MTVQERLNQLGYPAGVADGLMGPATRAAVRAYQRDAGLPQTGRPDQSDETAFDLFRLLDLGTQARLAAEANVKPAKVVGEDYHGADLNEFERPRLFRVIREQVPDLLLAPSPSSAASGRLIRINFGADTLLAPDRVKNRSGRCV